MKCQNCGKNEVSFHYSSNINGCVTQTYLCSECASKQGFDLGQFFSAGSAIGGFAPLLGRLGGFFPMGAPVMGSATQFPFGLIPATAPAAFRGGYGSECQCGCESRTPDVSEAVIDDEMKKRREINVLREQMRLAAENDDFERAIQLREQLKEIGQ